jgi:hypothetical protein
MRNILQEVSKMAETEHYKKILKLLNNNYPDQTVRFEALVDIDENIFDELWQWIRDFSSERDKRNIFSIVNIFNRIRTETKILNCTTNEVIKLSEIRTDLLGLSSFNFNYFFTVRNIDKMLLPESERVIFTEHHVFFEATNYKKGSLRELRNHDFAKVIIDIKTHKRLHADIEKNFPENPPIVSEKTARNLLNILDSQKIHVREEISEAEKFKILLHSLSLLIEESLKGYKEISTFENSEILIDAIKLERFIQAQSRWANKFKADS